MANGTKAPTAPAAEKAPKEKAPREKLQEIFKDEASAVNAAAERTKGPRRAFKATFNGKDLFVVANNEGRAGGVAFLQAGGTVEEVGKVTARKPKAMGLDAILAAIGSLPEAERAQALAQVQATLAKK